MLAFGKTDFAKLELTHTRFVCFSDIELPQTSMKFCERVSIDSRKSPKLYMNFKCISGHKTHLKLFHERVLRFKLAKKKFTKNLNKKNIYVISEYR